MNEFVQAVLAAIGLAVVVAGCGASFAFSVAAVWKKMQWAPVNITLHVHHHGDGDLT